MENVQHMPLRHTLIMVKAPNASGVVHQLCWLAHMSYLGALQGLHEYHHMLPNSRLAGLSRFSLSISHSARFVVVTLQFAVHDCGQLICAADDVVQLPLGLLLAALCLQAGSVTAAVALLFSICRPSVAGSILSPTCGCQMGWLQSSG